MNKEKKINFDTLFWGIITGLAAPVITLFIIWLFRDSNSFGEFLVQMQSINMLAKLLSLCAIPNLLFFFIFIWLNKLYSSKGVLFATILYGLLIIVLKLI